jgi:hypothetical protein
MFDFVKIWFNQNISEPGTGRKIEKEKVTGIPFQKYFRYFYLNFLPDNPETNFEVYFFPA